MEHRVRPPLGITKVCIRAVAHRILLVAQDVCHRIEPISPVLIIAGPGEARHAVIIFTVHLVSVGLQIRYGRGVARVARSDGVRVVVYQFILPVGKAKLLDAEAASIELDVALVAVGVPYSPSRRRMLDAKRRLVVPAIRPHIR